MAPLHFPPVNSTRQSILLFLEGIPKMKLICGAVWHAHKQTKERVVGWDRAKRNTVCPVDDHGQWSVAGAWPTDNGSNKSERQKAKKTSSGGTKKEMKSEGKNEKEKYKKQHENACFACQAAQCANFSVKRWGAGDRKRRWMGDKGKTGKITQKQCNKCVCFVPQLMNSRRAKQADRSSSSNNKRNLNRNGNWAHFCLWPINVARSLPPALCHLPPAALATFCVCVVTSMHSVTVNCVSARVSVRWAHLNVSHFYVAHFKAHKNGHWVTASCCCCCCRSFSVLCRICVPERSARFIVINLKHFALIHILWVFKMPKRVQPS